jgi:hypothetical protein
MDDANDEGGPGECPGHDFVLRRVEIKPHGAGMEHECRWCGAVLYLAPGWSTRGEWAPEQT